MGVIYTCADWLVEEGREADFVREWTEFVDWSLERGDGAIGGMVLQDPSEPRRFFTIGPWESADALRAWMSDPSLEERSEPLKGLADQFQPRLLELRGRRGSVE
jgi:heme-degrading monooxygenase HmoA